MSRESTRSFTPAQKAAVDRVRKCRNHDYYAILDIEISCTDGEVKRAYRKLALIMHPDKNSAPGADEAFKLVSKAFQILSDPQKKRIFDQTGSDPDSRGGGGGGGFSSGFSRAGAGGGGGGGNYRQEMTPDDLFNMFFSGGQGGGFGGGGFGGFDFGPGVRVHTFGGGGSPFDAFMGGNRAQAQGVPRGAQRRRQPQEENWNTQVLFPTIVLIITLFVILLGDSFSALSDQAPHFEFTPAHPYTHKMQTPKYKVNYYVKERDIKDISKNKHHQLNSQVENNYVYDLKNRCNREYAYKQQKIQDSQGWFFTDEQQLEEAENLKLPFCDKLKDLQSMLL